MEISVTLDETYAYLSVCNKPEYFIVVQRNNFCLEYVNYYYTVILTPIKLFQLLKMPKPTLPIIK